MTGLREPHYSLGLDFGTLSVRALLVDLSTGTEAGISVQEYPHGVMVENLPSGAALGTDWALQDPQDYLFSLQKALRNLQQITHVNPDMIVGIGVDFTACTILPVKFDGTPLSEITPWKNRPHAYVKLWKHHAAQKQADAANALAKRRKEGFLERYGGKISSEWLLPKVMQILQEDPEIFGETDLFVEAGDWIVHQLTGQWKRNSCAAGYKAGYVEGSGFYNPTFLTELDPRLARLEDKLSPVFPSGTLAGTISESASRLFGLSMTTNVAVASVDAHVAVPAAGIVEPGKMLMIMGTSTCHMVLSDQEILVKGISGVVKDGIIDGFYGYEAGQACVGDHFQWVVDHITPHSYFIEAQARGISLHQYLTELASKKTIGQTNLIALDWFNGVRSVLVDASLSGMIVGMTLSTRAEDVYRALIEATAFGTRKIIDAFETQGIQIRELFATGGIAEKNPFLMQIYADVTHREIRIVGASQAVAFGSAIFGAVAAGKTKGGFDTLPEAVRVMVGFPKKVFLPDPSNVVAYDRLYEKYLVLHDYFGIEKANLFRKP
jgi:L-ribulokinase